MSDEMERRAREFLGKRYRSHAWLNNRAKLLAAFAEQVEAETLEQAAKMALDGENQGGTEWETQERIAAAIRALAGGQSR